MNTGRPSTRRKPWMVVAVTAALSLAAGSCGDDDGGDDAQQASTTAGPATTGADEATPRRGGTFTYLQTIELTGWDVTQQTTVVPTSGSAAVAAVYDVLVYVDLEDGEVKGQTAESLTSTDAREWTLRLKPNIEFTDGTAYDADAVKFNWERHADPTNRSSHQSLAASIASMTVVDPLTLRITLKSPNGQFDRLVAGRIPYIGSPTAMRQDPAGFTTKPVGAGPFMLREWVRDSRATLVRNPNYWDAPAPTSTNWSSGSFPTRSSDTTASVPVKGTA